PNAPVCGLVQPSRKVVPAIPASCPRLCPPALTCACLRPLANERQCRTDVSRRQAEQRASGQPRARECPPGWGNDSVGRGKHYAGLLGAVLLEWQAAPVAPLFMSSQRPPLYCACPSEAARD